MANDREYLTVKVEGGEELAAALELLAAWKPFAIADAKAWAAEQGSKEWLEALEASKAAARVFLARVEGKSAPTCPSCGAGISPNAAHYCAMTQPAPKRSAEDATEIILRIIDALDHGYPRTCIEYVGALRELRSALRLILANRERVAKVAKRLREERPTAFDSAFLRDCADELERG